MESFVLERVKSIVRRESIAIGSDVRRVTDRALEGESWPHACFLVVDGERDRLRFCFSSRATESSASALRAIACQRSTQSTYRFGCEAAGVIKAVPYLRVENQS